MQVIPVIDLKGGQVVRGVGGQRDQYRPVQSQLTETATPREVAQTLCDFNRGNQLYVADLDAIAGAAPDWNAYQEILARQATMTLDAGVATRAEAHTLVELLDLHAATTSIVVALESSPSPDELQRILETVGVERAVFSLDLKEGSPVTDADAWRGQSAEAIAAAAIAIGFRRMIVLDLAAVGVAAGPNAVDLCAKIRAQYSDIELISGGGVRSIDDLRSFFEAGCDGVLVASALHDGRITRQDLENCDFLDGAGPA